MWIERSTARHRPGDKRGVLPDLDNPPHIVYREVSWKGNFLASPTQILVSLPFEGLPCEQNSLLKCRCLVWVPQRGVKTRLDEPQLSTAILQRVVDVVQLEHLLHLWVVSWEAFDKIHLRACRTGCPCSEHYAACAPPVTKSTWDKWLCIDTWVNDISFTDNNDDQGCTLIENQFQKLTNNLLSKWAFLIPVALSLARMLHMVEVTL